MVDRAHRFFLKRLRTRSKSELVLVLLVAAFAGNLVWDWLVLGSVLRLLSLLGLGALAASWVVLETKTATALEAEIVERRRAEQEARAAAQAKGEFLANMSHEIRTPLNAVIGLTELLLREQLSAVQRDRVEAINSSAEILLVLVDDVLDLAKIEAGKLSLANQDFDLAMLFEDLRRVFQPRALEKGLDLRFELGAGLPMRLRGDGHRLRQVLINLIGNAVKFTARGRVEIGVEDVGCDGERHVLRFRVVDTGVGISPRAQAKLFNPFTQADSSAGRRFGGTGLGLAISKRLVELMGGEIGCESQRGAGSTFWFRVPLLAAARAPEPRPEKPVAVPSSTPRQQVRILVIEDNPVNQLVAVEHLKVLGFQPEVANDGLEALALLERQRFDLLLMDCQMPGLDGYETTRRLRRLEGEGPRAVVIALTAHALQGERERCREAGMDDYISKPFRGEELAAILDRWLESAAGVDGREAG